MLQNFVDHNTPAIGAAWLNQVDNFVNTLFAGAVSAPAARTAIGAASAGANSDITALTGIAGPIALTGSAGGIGQVLTSQGPGVAPIWTTAGSGDVTTNGVQTLTNKSIPAITNQNLAVGTTSFAWPAFMWSVDAEAAAISGNSSGGGAYFTNNAYYNGTQWIHKYTGFAGMLDLTAGTFNISVGNNSSATNPVTWTNLFSLTAAGVGTLNGTFTSTTLQQGGQQVATLVGTETLTNKTLTAPNIAQIVFPATQVPSAGANVLDDYEEGTWTPAVGGTATYTSQVGRYTKIGRYVYIEGLLQINAIGTGATFQISGLPFTSNSTSGAGAVTVSLWSGTATAVTSIFGQVDSNATTITLRSTTTAASSPSANALFANAAYVYFAGHYTVA